MTSLTHKERVAARDAARAMRRRGISDAETKSGILHCKFSFISCGNDQLMHRTVRELRHRIREAITQLRERREPQVEQTPKPEPATQPKTARRQHELALN
jgi:hypothetical protein